MQPSHSMHQHSDASIMLGYSVTQSRQSYWHKSFAVLACLTRAADALHQRAHLLSGRAARLQTAPLWASTDCSLLEAPTSSTSRPPSLVPTTACLFPGANSAHRPYPASIVRRQAPDLGFQILTSLLDPDSRRESSLDSATVRMSERWPCDSKPCRRLTSSSLMCHTCSQEAAGKGPGYMSDLLAGCGLIRHS